MWALSSFVGTTWNLHRSSVESVHLIVSFLASDCVASSYTILSVHYTNSQEMHPRQAEKHCNDHILLWKPWDHWSDRQKFYLMWALSFVGTTWNLHRSSVESAHLIVSFVASDCVASSYTTFSVHYTTPQETHPRHIETHRNDHILLWKPWDHWSDHQMNVLVLLFFFSCFLIFVGLHLHLLVMM